MNTAHKIFQDKVAIVTGAGQGIGFEICRQLAIQGAHVILNDVEKSLATDAAEKIKREKGVCVPMAGDVSDVDFIQTMVEKAITQFGSVDIAIANAGITMFGDFLDYEPDDFYNVMRVNLGGTFFLAQAAARQMKEQRQGGSLLFMSSVTGHQAHKNLAAYSMSKAAVEMLAKSLVIELSPHKITVNALAPGATLTERTTKDAGYEKVWAQLTPTGRAATVADIASAALFLVSPQAQHITGQTLVIDGGWSSISPSPY
ncbi:MAG: SDR family NAD(P)-dependent oxidoreductase [Bacteroidota bacterium]